MVKKAATGGLVWYNSAFAIEPGDVPQYFYAACVAGATVDTTLYAYLQPGTDVPTADDFEPYTGTTTTLTLPETIYGGEVDAVSGVGSKEWKLVTITGNEQPHVYDDYFYLDGFNLGPGITEGVCSHYLYGLYVARKIGINANGSSIVYAPDGDFTVDQTGLESWKSYLAAQYAAGTPVTIAYKLATPTTLQATGSQSIPALPGTNTIYTDADSVTVTGRADPVQTINALNDRIAALEDAATGG